MSNGPHPPEHHPTPGPEPQPTGPGDGAVAVPPPVAQTAAQRDFGRLIDVRSDGGKQTKFLTGCGVAVAAVVVLTATAALIGDTSVFSPLYSVARVIGLISFFTAFWATVHAIRGLAAASHTYYLYEGGIVHTAGQQLRSMAWSEISRLVTVYERRLMGREGRITGYEAWSGPNSLTIPLVLVNGRDTFMDHVIGQVRSRNRPIN